MSHLLVSIQSDFLLSLQQPLGQRKSVHCVGGDAIGAKRFAELWLAE